MGVRIKRTPRNPRKRGCILRFTVIGAFAFVVIGLVN